MNLIQDRDIDIEHESIIDLLRDLRDEVMIIVRQQVELAKTETEEKVAKFTKNAALVAGGAVILYTGFLFLIAGLTFLGYQGMLNAGVSSDIAMWLMPIITAIIVGGVGAFLLFRSLNKIRHTSIAPIKTVKSIKEDQQWITRKVK
jgi:ABC-type nickel/cobalt efflux system permease component RcnA